MWSTPPVCMSKVSPRYLRAHGGALDVPAGITAAPGRVPLHDVLFWRLLPQREIGGVALLGVDVHARSRDVVVQVRVARELAVAGELGNVEVYAVARFVAVALIHERFHEFQHIRYVVGGFGDDFGAADVELVDVREEEGSVVLRDLPGRHARLFRRLFHLVLALVRVRGEMTDVRDVHDAEQLVPVEAYDAAQRVHEYIRAHVAHVRTRIDRRPAGVHAYFARHHGLEFFLSSGKSVVNYHRWILSRCFCFPLRPVWLPAPVCAFPARRSCLRWGRGGTGRGRPRARRSA